jgi:preprotein translocase subunit SecY
MWLGEQITERGHRQRDEPAHHLLDLERLWPPTLQLVQFIRSNVVTPIGAVVFLAVLVGVVAAVVAMTIAARRIPIQIPRKVMGRGRIREGQKTFIPIRLITAG